MHVVRNERFYVARPMFLEREKGWGCARQRASTAFLSFLKQWPRLIKEFITDDMHTIFFTLSNHKLTFHLDFSVRKREKYRTSVVQRGSSENTGYDGKLPYVGGAERLVWKSGSLRPEPKARTSVPIVCTYLPYMYTLATSQLVTNVYIRSEPKFR